MTTPIGRCLTATAATAAATAAALLSLPHAARAQQPAAPAFRYAVEGYAAQYELDNGMRLGTRSPYGFGLRVAGYRRDPNRATHTLAERATGSLFATYTAEQGSPGVTTLHVGIQTDASFLDRPLGGVFDPFLSFGAGIFRTSTANPQHLGNGKRVTHSDFAFIPAVGTRVPFFDGVGARLDLRAPIVFGTSTTANLVAEGGVYFSF